MSEQSLVCPNCGHALAQDFLVTGTDPDAALVSPFLEQQPADSRFTSSELHSAYVQWLTDNGRLGYLTRRRVSAAAVKLGWVGRKSRGYTYYMPPAAAPKPGRPAVADVDKDKMPRSRRMVVDWLEQLKGDQPKFYRGRHASKQFYDDFMGWLNRECHQRGRDVNDWRFPASRQQVGRVLVDSGWRAGRDAAHGRYFEWVGV